MTGWLTLRRFISLVFISLAALAMVATFAADWLSPSFTDSLEVTLHGRTNALSASSMPALGLMPENADYGLRRPANSAAGIPGAQVGQRFPARAFDLGQRPDPELPLKLEVVKDGVTVGGQAEQVLRVSFEPGATFSHLAVAIFDDPSRINDLFEQAKSQHPNLRSPNAIGYGMSFDVTIDPAVTFVLLDSKLENGVKVRTYTNGVVEKVFPADGAHGISRIVDFPRGRQIKEYRWPADDAVVAVPAQARLVDYQYKDGGDIRAAIEQMYGAFSSTSVENFVSQTNWNPVDHPLENNSWHKLVFSTARSFAEEPPAAVRLKVSDPTLNAKLEELARQRAAANVYLIDHGDIYDTFSVRAFDPNVRASAISTVIFGVPDRMDDIVAAARITLPEPAANQDGNVSDIDAEVKDRSIFGRSFTIQVDQADQHFPDRVETQGDQRVTTLLNGVVIKESVSGGNNTIIQYPSGYRKLRYQPPVVTRLILDYLSFLPQIPGYLVDIGRPYGPDRDQQVRERAAARAQALPQMIWTWDLGVPRSFGDVPLDARLIEPAGSTDQTEPVLEVLLMPQKQVGLIQSILHARVYYKLAVLAAIIGTGIVVVVGSSLALGEQRSAEYFAIAAGRPKRIKV